MTPLLALGGCALIPEARWRAMQAEVAPETADSADPGDGLRTDALRALTADGQRGLGAQVALLDTRAGPWAAASSDDSVLILDAGSGEARASLSPEGAVGALAGGDGLLLVGMALAGGGTGAATLSCPAETAPYTGRCLEDQVTLWGAPGGAGALGSGVAALGAGDEGWALLGASGADRAWLVSLPLPEDSDGQAIAAVAEGALSADDEGQAGAAVALGDVDGDGVADLLIGAPLAGRVDLVLGGGVAERALEDADLRCSSEASMTRLGVGLAAADVDGDGRADWAVSATRGGTARVVLGAAPEQSAATIEQIAWMTLEADAETSVGGPVALLAEPGAGWLAVAADQVSAAGEALAWIYPTGPGAAGSGRGVLLEGAPSSASAPSLAARDGVGLALGLPGWGAGGGAWIAASELLLGP